MFAYRNGDLPPLTAWFIFKKTLRESWLLLLFFLILGWVDMTFTSQNESLYQNLFITALYGPSAYITSITAVKITIIILCFRPKGIAFEERFKFIMCVAGIYACFIWPIKTFILEKNESFMLLFNETWDFYQFSTYKMGKSLFIKWLVVQVFLMQMLLGDIKKLKLFYGYRICKDHMGVLMKCQVFSAGFLILVNYIVEHLDLQPFYTIHQALIVPMVTYGFTGFIMLFYTTLAQELDWRYERLAGFNEFN